MSDWYDVSGVPGTGAEGRSIDMRGEFILVQNNISTKLPTLTGRASRPVFVNSSGTGLETITVAAAIALYGLDVGINTGITAGAANTYTVTIASVTAYTNLQGYRLKINATNTAASTLNISGLGAKTIKRLDGSDIQAGDLMINRIYDFAYNSTDGIITLMTLMPDTVQSSSPTFTTINVTTAAASGNITAAQFGSAHSTVVMSGGNATFAVDQFGTFDISVTGNCTVTLTATDLTKSYQFTIFATTTGAYNFTSLTMSGITIYRKVGTTINLPASGSSALACVYIPAASILIVTEVDVEAI